jgi:hypothetical protein
MCDAMYGANALQYTHKRSNASCYMKEPTVALGGKKNEYWATSPLPFKSPLYQGKIEYKKILYNTGRKEQTGKQERELARKCVLKNIFIL